MEKDCKVPRQRPTPLGGGQSEKAQSPWDLAGCLPYVTYGSVGAQGGSSPAPPDNPFLEQAQLVA
jgi:hypothetical protein